MPSARLRTIDPDACGGSGAMEDSSGRRPRLSVVIPTRHEAATIEGFLARVLRALEGIPAEVVVVDDSDHDNTMEALLRFRRRDPERIVVLHRPVGIVAERTLGTAVVDGIRVASGDFVCIMDADGQHPPEAIPELLALAEHSGADYVGGTRYVRGGSAEGFDAGRAAISRGLALTTRLAFLLTPIRGVSDPLSGFFLFRRALVDGVDLKPIGWKISLEILVRARVRRLAEVPYTFARRDDGDSKATVRQGLLVLRHILVLLLSLAGVRRFLSFGLVGASGMAVNIGSLVALQSLGFDALAWPIWASTELAILWNYVLNRRITWRDRTYGRWWLYNIAAIWSSLIAIGATEALVVLAGTPLWLGSVAGITIGMATNYVLFDKVVFASLLWMSVRFDVPALQPALPADR
jgi:dolichol-phosphate mannosyltransferase